MEMEIWKPVKNFEDSYEINNYGKVRGFSSSKGIWGIEIKPQVVSNGYLRISLRRNKIAVFKTIHKLVAETFIPNPDNKPQVNHIDGDKANNRVENLEWCTYRENINHAILHNLSSCGERNGMAKLNINDVLYIYESLVLGVPIYILADKYSVCSSTIMGIKTASQWTILKLTPIKGRASSVTLDIIEKIESFSYLSERKIHDITKHSRELIRKIKNKEYEQLKNRLKEIQGRV